MTKKQSITFDCSPPPRAKIPLTPENLKYACRRIALSESSIPTIAFQDPKFPTWDDLLDWIEQDASIKERFLEAKALQALVSTDNMLEIAYNTTNETWAMTQAVLGQKRWAAQKLLREIFGDKLQVDHKQIRNENWIELMREPDTLMIEDIK